MGFFDFFTGDWGEALGNGLSSLGDGLGITSALSGGEKSEKQGIAAGGASALSGLTGVMSGIGKLLGGKKEDGGWDIANGVFGLAGGIADMGAGAYGSKAEKETDAAKKKELLQKKGKWQKASGGIGILGGILSGVKSIMDIKNAKTTEDKIGAWTGLAGGVTQILGGIGNIGAGKYAAEDENGPNKGKIDFWDKWGKGVSIIGALPGLISSGKVGVDKLATK